VLSFLSLLVAAGALLFSAQQTSAAKDSLNTANAQLRLAWDAQKTAEGSYLVAKEQLDFQRKSTEDENRFPVVYDGAFLNALRQPLVNQEVLPFSFVNRTKRSQSYRVSVLVTGIGVDFEGQTPAKLIGAINLDSNWIVVPPDGEYKQSFVVWHGAKPAPHATLTILINSTPALVKKFDYDQKSSAYVPAVD